MFVGDMTIKGHIEAGECRSTATFALEYPNPGDAVTITNVQGISLKKPTAGKCVSRGSTLNSTTTSVLFTTTSSTSNRKFVTFITAEFEST
jgi:hypothetical protein